ncbi:tRNA-dihydrouridine synthase family protein [uncultured Draconibacterium sp.]|uniref:tRNA-dihydrouridine synthase family protein n=1 Tax=uncultured Draconibacterium sp. TaxID=1573823 RepID=UPI0025E70EBB|nr:tRNA-dihydrouridine synthase family protein [uncultured Draconibacterium sp.]
MIYLAPLQGFTDFVYRAAHAAVFNSIDAYFIPYISLKHNKILPKYFREISPQNNRQMRVVPQVLAKDGNELALMAKQLRDLDYAEINLNLGCPYPMVTNRGKGAGLLATPAKVYEILERFFSTSEGELSVKLRSGLQSDSELSSVIDVLNQFPIKEVIYHPRIASQLYSGEIDENAYLFARQQLKHRLVYNGDIFSVKTYTEKKEVFLQTNTWMLGRGVLMNPLLPNEIMGVQLSKEKRDSLLFLFHKYVLEGYLEAMDNEGNALNKMKQFWIYFSHSFPAHKKVLKLVNKAKEMNKYRSAIRTVFDQ